MDILGRSYHILCVLLVGDLLFAVGLGRPRMWETLFGTLPEERPVCTASYEGDNVRNAFERGVRDMKSHCILNIS